MNAKVSKTVFFIMVKTIIDDVEMATEFGASAKPSDILGALSHGLKDSRLTPRWNSRIDTALKILTTDIMHHAVAVAEKVMEARHIIEIMDEYGEFSRFDRIRALRVFNDGCSFEVATDTLTFLGEGA